MLTEEERSFIANALDTAREVYRRLRDEAMRAAKEDEALRPSMIRLAAQFDRQCTEATRLILKIQE